MNPLIIVLIIFAIIVVIAAIGLIRLILKPFMGGKTEEKGEEDGGSEHRTSNIEH